ncbi:MAG TPA: hypothetical protein VNL77_16120 [Roseiflexaceae bacterium]|nr:hypothetical protein [Roseiflexaceae bacterium]
MTTIDVFRARARSRQVIALTLLLAVQFVGVGVLFPLHAFTSPPGSPALQAFAVGLALFGLLTIYGVWAEKRWGAWAALTLVSFKLTIDVYSWALGLDRPLALLSAAVNLGIIALLFRIPAPAGAEISRMQKVFFGCVLALAANVGVIGMFNPPHAVNTLPFAVPPLHARFLGAMYLSGATFMALAILARRWHEVRVVTPMVSVWTGLLGLVSLLHLEAFDWAREQVWTWFAAYIAFPLIAAWMAWQQRAVEDPPEGAPLGPALRGYLAAQGAAVTLLALGLLLVPDALAARWPWKATPLLVQIYSAPFMSYGVGSLLAARRRAWAEVRIMIAATLVFTVGVLGASLVHRGLFAPAAPATWLWFGGFALATAVLAALGLLSRGRV